MIDAATHRHVRVSGSAHARPYITVAVDQVDAVAAVLRENQIPYAPDAYAVAVNGAPEVTVIHLERGADADHIQQLLDSIP